MKRLKLQKASPFLCAAVLMMGAAEAEAAMCSGFQFPAGSEVVLGEEEVAGVGTGRLAVCFRPAGGGAESYYLASGCTTATPVGDQFFAWGSTGNETIGPLMNPILCNGVTPMRPWNPAFQFGLNASMGAGRDVVYGTPNADILFSKYDQTLMTTDASNDRLCGYEGDDRLTGDADEAAVSQECLNGGNGKDTCNGGNDGNAFDTAYVCEFKSNVNTVSTATCGCGSEPPAFW